MKSGNLFRRYLWLYDEIIEKGPITFKQIASDWMRSSINTDSKPLSHKTFENHRKMVEELLNISIECCRRTNRYYIAEDTVYDLNRAAADMLNSALLFTRIQADAQLSKYIRPEIMSDNVSYLATIIDALKKNNLLNIRYRHNYDTSKEHDYNVKPVGVKQFRRRWYLIAELHDGTTYSYALDRVLSMEIGESSAGTQLSVDSLFTDAFGIIREPGVSRENIILRVEREQANYFLALPLHASQHIVEQDEKTVTFELQVAPTFDLIMEILSYGSKVEVLSPLTLRNKIFEIVTDTINLYKTKKQK